MLASPARPKRIERRSSQCLLHPIAFSRGVHPAASPDRRPGRANPRVEAPPARHTRPAPPLTREQAPRVPTTACAARRLQSRSTQKEPRAHFRSIAAAPKPSLREKPGGFFYHCGGTRRRERRFLPGEGGIRGGAPRPRPRWRRVPRPGLRWRSHPRRTPRYAPASLGSGHDVLEQGADLYLASYDASGHAEFSGGVSARVAPAAPLSGALPVSEPRAFRVPLALVHDNRGDREIRRRLNERLTRGTRVSERRGWRDAGAHPRARALGWSRDSATRLDDARLDVSETFGQNARGDAGDRGDRGESPKRRGSWRSDAASTSPRRDPAARSARAAWRRPPPTRRSRSASSGRSSPGRASTSSPSASSTSSWIIASSREEEEEEEEVFCCASTRVNAKARADAENPPVSPEARAAARVDALLAGLGVVVFSPDADRSARASRGRASAADRPRPRSAPRAASSARGRRALARDSEIGDSITIGF